MIRVFLLFFLCGVLMADLPEYKPPFSSGTMKRLPPELKVDSFLKNGKQYDQPYFLIGNKRIGLRRLYNQDRIDRDFIIGVQVDGKDVFHIRFWGSLPGGNSGWPFRDGEEKGTILVDRDAKTITYRKNWSGQRFFGKHRVSRFQRLDADADMIRTLCRIHDQIQRGILQQFPVVRVCPASGMVRTAFGTAFRNPVGDRGKFKAFLQFRAFQRDGVDVASAAPLSDNAHSNFFHGKSPW